MSETHLSRIVPQIAAGDGNSRARGGASHDANRVQCADTRLASLSQHPRSGFLIMPLKRCYAAKRALPIAQKFALWIFDHLLWDPAGSARVGFWGGLWATRKLVIAFAGAALLTWREWVEHHPPEIAIVAVIHFVFVLAVIALLVYIGQRFSHSDRKSLSKR